MKKQFTKWSMVVALVVGSLLNAQTNENKGHVGINTQDVRATLDVKISPENLTTRTNEGFIPPEMTKTRLAAITPTKLVDGTIVKVTSVDEYKGKEPIMAEVTEPGLYAFVTNEQKWKKLIEKYTGQDGIEVDKNIISLNGETLNAINNAKSIDINTIAKKDLQMVPLSKVRINKRRQIIGVDGFYIKESNGTWKYTGMCRVYKAFFVENNRKFINLNTRNLPTYIIAAGLYAGSSGRPSLFVQGTLYRSKTDQENHVQFGNTSLNTAETISKALRDEPYQLQVQQSNLGVTGNNKVSVVCNPIDLWLYE